MRILQYKDDYVDFGLAYVSKQLRMRQVDETTVALVDSLFQEAPEYPQVKDMYVNVLFAPYVKNLNSNIKKARSAALKVYKKFPEHPLAREAIASVYHRMAMEALRKNKMKEAYKLLVEGLELVPENKLLNESFEQLEKM